MADSKMGPFRLAPWFSPRPWGRRDLRPWYADTGTTEPVGEAWLTGPESAVETGPKAGRTLAEVAAEAGGALLGAAGGREFPLLVKLLFPNDKLSVQVHPDDAQAQAMGQPRGKTECWYVLEAEPGATIALGLREGATAQAVRAAIADGTMEEWMQWVPVAVGDMVFVDAGTVHAIGPGVVLLETQQTSDITFRMYDFGRPRELHVEPALRVMKLKTAAGKVKPRKMDGFARLIEQKYFVVDRYEVGEECEAVIAIAEAGCLVGLTGLGVVESKGAEPVELLPGRAVVVPAEVGEVVVRSNAGAEFVRCWAP
ncbi:MAG: type I phosphomannose isomerase catalytic subunit [Acidobacteriaceae bacterium]|jgi:mannose-6-phosphate isomerase